MIVCDERQRDNKFEIVLETVGMIFIFNYCGLGRTSWDLRKTIFETSKKNRKLYKSKEILLLKSKRCLCARFVFDENSHAARQERIAHVTLLKRQCTRANVINCAQGAPRHTLLRTGSFRRFSVTTEVSRVPSPRPACSARVARLRKPRSIKSVIINCSLRDPHRALEHNAAR